MERVFVLKTGLSNCQEAIRLTNISSADKLECSVSTDHHDLVRSPSRSNGNGKDYFDRPHFPPTEKEMSKKVCYFFPPPFLLATKLSSPPSLPLPPWLKPSWRRALLSVFRLATPTRGKPQRMMCPTMTMTRRALTT